MLRLATTLENAGIAVFAVSEDNTSKECAYHKVEVRRKPRGLIHCPREHTLHADVNAALNIMARGWRRWESRQSYQARSQTKSFITTPSGVIPVKP